MAEGLVVRMQILDKDGNVVGTETQPLIISSDRLETAIGSLEEAIKELREWLELNK